MTIQFGDWQLRKMDANNWELYHRHVTKENAKSLRSGSAGKVQWNRMGRYYQKSTFANAIEYAADWDMRNAEGGTVTLGQYIKAYNDTLESFRAEFERSMRTL